MEYTSRKKALCIGLGILLVCVELYLHFFALMPMKRQVEAMQIDKVLHMAGGVFLVSLLEWRFRRLSFWHVLILVFVLSLSWKAFEFFMDPAAHHYVSTHLRVWTLDLIGDCAATVLGGLLYWRAAIGK